MTVRMSQEVLRTPTQIQLLLRGQGYAQSVQNVISPKKMNLILQMKQADINNGTIKSEDLIKKQVFDHLLKFSVGGS
jgi:hypothetical protein